MNAFLWTIIILFALSAVALAHALAVQNFKRNPAAMVLDIALMIGLALWAIFLLGKS